MQLPQILLSGKTFAILCLFCLIFFALFLTFLILYLQERNEASNKLNKILQRAEKNGEYATAFLDGGLGNQLFEVANAYAYAQRTGKTFVLNKSLKQVSVGSGTPRPTYFDGVFRWTQNDTTERKWIDWTEPHFHYAEIPNLHGDIQLKGYFQSPKYFQDYRQDLVTKLFNPKLISQFTLPSLETHPTVSLHIRRTDYMAISLFAKQPMSYYQQAIQHLQDHVSKSLYLIIFSDDTKWCKENLDQLLKDDSDDLKMYFIGDNNENPTDEQELLLMSTCQHHIIANSSFSWWGAYLDQKPNNTVIAPKLWFTHTHNWQDIYVPGWVIL